jgi:type I restriction enzyme M protein
MIDPQIGETVYDPAAGTAGFLVAAYNHLRLANSSPDAIEEVELDGKLQTRGHGAAFRTRSSAPSRTALSTAAMSTPAWSASRP